MNTVFKLPYKKLTAFTLKIIGIVMPKSDTLQYFSFPGNSYALCCIGSAQPSIYTFSLITGPDSFTYSSGDSPLPFPQKLCYVLLTIHIAIGRKPTNINTK